MTLQLGLSSFSKCALTQPDTVIRAHLAVLYNDPGRVQHPRTHSDTVRYTQLAVMFDVLGHVQCCKMHSQSDACTWQSCTMALAASSVPECAANLEFAEACCFGGCCAVKVAGVAPDGTSRIQVSSLALSHSASAQNRENKSSGLVSARLSSCGSMGEAGVEPEGTSHIQVSGLALSHSASTHIRQQELVISVCEVPNSGKVIHLIWQPLRKRQVFPPTARVAPEGTSRIQVSRLGLSHSASAHIRQQERQSAFSHPQRYSRWYCLHFVGLVRDLAVTVRYERQVVSLTAPRTLRCLAWPQSHSSSVHIREHEFTIGVSLKLAATV